MAEVDILSWQMDILAGKWQKKASGTQIALIQVKRNYAKYANNVHYAQTQDTQAT